MNGVVSLVQGRLQARVLFLPRVAPVSKDFAQLPARDVDVVHHIQPAHEIRDLPNLSRIEGESSNRRQRVIEGRTGIELDHPFKRVDDVVVKERWSVSRLDDGRDVERTVAEGAVGVGCLSEAPIAWKVLHTPCRMWNLFNVGVEVAILYCCQRTAPPRSRGKSHTSRLRSGCLYR